MAATAKKIQEQVEFYFSQSNLQRDVFLKKAIAADAERFVPISTLLTFNRLKALTTEPDVIVEALKKSEVVEVSSCETKIRSISELNPIDTSKERTLYAKGYPIDDAEITIENISKIWSEYGKVLMVRMRKEADHTTFKGSLFVEYDTEEAMQKAIKAAHDGDDKITMKYKETELLCVMPLADWLQRKTEKKARRAKQNEKRKATAVATGDDTADGDKQPAKKAKKEENEGEGEESKEEEKVEFTPGLILKIGGIPTDASFQQLKDFFKALGDIKYVEYNNGETDGFVRFGNLEAAETVKAVLDKGVPLVAGGENMSAERVTGDEEYEYWKKIDREGKSKNAGGGKRGKGGRGGGRGGRGRGRGGFKKGRKSY